MSFGQYCPNARDLRAGVRARGTGSGVAAVRSVLDWIFLWQERAESRRRLLALDDRMLRDIGVNQATAAHEGEKPFWR
jgi:uncharacterized protein YjiS (DUF1127 family)